MLTAWNVTYVERTDVHAGYLRIRRRLYLMQPATQQNRHAEREPGLHAHLRRLEPRSDSTRASSPRAHGATCHSIDIAIQHYGDPVIANCVAPRTTGCALANP